MESQHHTNLTHLTNEVPNYHKNCFLSPVKSNDAIVKNFFFLNWYAQGEYVGVKKILIRAVINSGINKQILGM